MRIARLLLDQETVTMAILRWLRMRRFERKSKLSPAARARLRAGDRPKLRLDSDRILPREK